MNYSGNVYLLIKALTKAERRYFSLQAGFNRENSHLLQVFEAISRRGLEDDARLKEWLKDSGFVGHLDVLKVHLYQLILSSMRAYHKNRNKQREIRAMIDDLHFLYEKSLYSQCRKLLDKAIAAANEIGYYAALVDLLDIERMLLGVEHLQQYNEIGINQILQKEILVVNTLQSEAEFKHLGSMSGFLNKRYGHARSPEDFEALSSFTTQTKQMADKATTIRSKRLWNYSLMAFTLTTGNYEEALLYNAAIIESYGDNQILIRENPIGLISAIGNQIIICIRLKKYNDALRLLNKLHDIPQYLSKSQRRSKELILRIRLNELNYRMGIYLECGWMQLAGNYINEFEQFIALNIKVIPGHRLNEMYFSALYYYFITGDFNKAFVYLQLLESGNLQNSKADLFNSLQIIKLLMHYDLGNKHLLPYLVRSVYRMLLHVDQLYTFEHTLIRFMRKNLIHVTDKKSAKKQFIRLKNELNKIQTDQYEQHAFIMFDIIAWLDSKIHEKPYGQAIADIHTNNQ